MSVQLWIHLYNIEMGHCTLVSYAPQGQPGCCCFQCQQNVAESYPKKIDIINRVHYVHTMAYVHQICRYKLSTYLWELQAFTALHNYGAPSLTRAHTLESTVRTHSLTLDTSHIPSDKHLLYASAVLSIVWQGEGRADSPGEAVGQEILESFRLTFTVNINRSYDLRMTSKFTVRDSSELF